MHLRHLNKTAKKYSYEVILHDVTGLSALLSPPPHLHLPQPPYRPSDPFILSIHSRSKRNATRVSPLTSSTLSFDESLSFTSTLFFSSSSSSPTFDPKPFTFTLTNLRLQQERAKAYMHLTATLDLSRFSSATGEELEQPHSLQLQVEKGKGGVKVDGVELRLTVRSRYVGEGVASEVSLLSVVSRGSGSGGSQMRVDEGSRLRRWRERGEERQEEEEVAMRRKEREEEVSQASSNGVDYRAVKLDLRSDDDRDERSAHTQQRSTARQQRRRAEEEQRQSEEAEDDEQPDSGSQQRSGRRQPFNPAELFRVDSMQRRRAEAPPAVSIADILPALRATSTSSTEHLQAAEALSTLAPPINRRSVSVQLPMGGLAKAAELEVKEGGEGKGGKKPLKKAASLSSTSLLHNSSAVQRPPPPPRPPLLSQPSIFSPRANIHLPPSFSHASTLAEHEQRYRQRMEPRLAYALSVLFPSSLYTSSAFHTAVASLSSLPVTPCVFFSSFAMLRQQVELDEERKADERQRWQQSQEQQRWLSLTEKEKRKWKSQRENDRTQLDRLRSEEEAKERRSEREEEEEERRRGAERWMVEECRTVGREWYFHAYHVSAITLYRLLHLCHAFHADVEEVEVEAPEGEEGGDAGGDDGGEDGGHPRVKKKKKARLKRPAYSTVRVTTARRGWVMEAALRAMRRKAEESRDHYGDLLWLINALLLLHHCVRQRRTKEEGEGGGGEGGDEEEEGEKELRVRVMDFGVGMPVNGKVGSRQGTGGDRTPMDGPSSTTAFVPHYPFLSSSSMSASSPLFTYARSPLSSSLTPLSFFLHHTRGLLHASLSLLFHHLSFALSYRIPLSSILSPSSFALETLLDFLSDTNALLSLSLLHPPVRLTVLLWLMRALSTRIVNAVLFEAQRAMERGVGEEEEDAYELPLATPIIHRASSHPSPPPLPASQLPSPAPAPFSASASQPVLLPPPPTSSSSSATPPLFTDPSSFLTLGMRLMMVVSATKDWMLREGGGLEEGVERVGEAVAPLQGLGMLCLAEKGGGGKAGWRAQCRGLRDEQVAVVLALLERLGGERVGEAWKRKGKGGEGVSRGVWVEWPVEVAVPLRWDVVPFAASSVGVPRGLRDTDGSRQVDGLQDNDGLLIT